MEKQKDEEFFKEAIVVLYPDIYRFVRSITKDTYVAQDVAQNTMEKAWKNLHQLRDRSKAKSWVFQIARNESTGVFRNAKYEESFDEPDGEMSYERIGGLGDDILEILLRKERNSLLVRALDMLSPRHKELVKLWALGDLSQKEIAEVLQINYNTARVTLYRGLKELRDIYFALERGDFDE